MAEDSDSDSSSTPIAPPGGGPLIFLPVQQSQPNSANDNDNDNSDSSSDTSSDATPIGIPGGPINDLSFVPVNDTPDNKDKDNDEDIKSANVNDNDEDIKSENVNDAKYDSDVWDLVYMTSSPLVCVQTETESDAKVIPLELLDVSRETEQIMSVLSGAGRELCVVHSIATTGNLIRAMTHRCRILHYSGHGFPGYLAFEDENSIGDTDMLRDIAFKNIIMDNKLQFVFTSACHSESVGLSFVSAGVPHVVSIDTKFEVSDEGAMRFTKYFYQALLCGRTISDSFNLAKQSVQFISSSAKRDFEKFKLLPPSGNHSVTLFNGLRRGKIVNATAITPPNNLGATIQPFIGRSVEMRSIIHTFMAKKNENCRIVNIYGDHGVGKSSITVMLARYLNDRKIYFKNGIYYIDSKKLIQNEDAVTLTEMINTTININTNNKGDTTILIDNLKLFCRYTLFIIDDIDQLISYYKKIDIDLNRELYGVIFKILVQVSEKIKFIMISKKKVSAHIFNIFDLNSTISPRPYHLKRLSSSAAAKLFAKLSGGSWRPSDIRDNIDIMSILKNNPFNIHSLAALKNEYNIQTLTKLVETYNFKSTLQRKQGNTLQIHDSNKGNREELIMNNIDNSAAQQVWRKAHGMEQCHYHKIFEILKYDFTEYTFSKRKLEQNNLMQCFRTLGMNQDLTIDIQIFDKMYLWFNGLTRLVQVLSVDYNKVNPLIIHGFVSRDDSHRMLSKDDIPCGTFIIRFRYKAPKSIAISYKQSHKSVSNFKCDLSNNSNLFICGKKLLPLTQFILTFHVLKYVYHSTKPIPKEDVFKMEDNKKNIPKWNHTQSWNPPKKQLPTMQQHAPTQNVYHQHHKHHQHF